MKGLWTYIRLTQSKAWIWQCLAIALVAVLLFLPLLNGGLCLFSTDNNIGDTARTKAFFPHGFLGIWGDSVLLGSAGVAGGNWLTAMMWLMPLRGYVNWFHAVDLGLAALGLTWFLRLKRCSWLACMPAWLAAFWVGSNFTLVYAGHIGKYGVLLFAVLALGCIEKAFQTRRIAWGVLTGGALGLMLLEQPDLAMFFGLAIAGYGLFSLLVRAKDARIWKFACLLLPAMALPLLLIAGQSLVGSYTANVSDTVKAQVEDPQAKWEFCTQWSVPPDETIDLIAPNYTGIRSGEPEGPYWGRTGQSAGWEQTRQGFMNFRLESIYIGAIPVALAMFAIVAALLGGGGFGVQGSGAPPDQRPDETEGATSVAACLRQVVVPVTNQTPQLAHDRHATARSAAATGKIRPEPRTLKPEPSWSDRRSEILFWGAAALIALLLAYGKYFPLYALFYQLPVVNNIRNPNKFIQVFQLCLGILAAYGLDEMLKSRKGKEV